MITFAEYLRQFDNLFLEMPRYGVGSANLVPMDEEDVAYLKPFKEALEKLAKEHGIELSDADYVDVFSQALRYRYGPKTMKYKGGDQRDLSFSLPSSKITHVKAIGKEKERRRSRHFNGVLVTNVPINADHLRAKFKDRGYDPDLVVWKDYISQNQAYKFLKLFRGELSLSDISYNPPQEYRTLDKDKGDEVSDKPSRRRGDEGEMSVKSLDKIDLDQDDNNYLSDVRAALEEYKEKFSLGGDIEKYVIQAFAVRYSNCFVGKQGDKFVPTPDYKYETGQVILRRPGGTAIKIPFSHSTVKSQSKIRINASKLAEKFDKVKRTIGYDFVENPLIKCSNGSPTSISSGTGVQTAHRWIKNGFFQPFSGTTGSEFLPDETRLAEIEEAQRKYIKGQGESPNESSKSTPTIEWEKLVRHDVVGGFYDAKAMICKKRNIAQDRCYLSYIENEKDDIINTVFSQVYYGLSGMKEYTNEKWRKTRAATLIKSYIEKHIDPRYRSQSADARVGEEGGGSSLADMASKQEPATVANVMANTTDRPELSPTSSDADIKAWVDSYFRKDDQSVDRRYNPKKGELEVDIYDSGQYLTRNELLRKMLAHYAQARGQ